MSNVNRNSQEEESKVVMMEDLSIKEEDGAKDNVDDAEMSLEERMNWLRERVCNSPTHFDPVDIYPYTRFTVGG